MEDAVVLRQHPDGRRGPHIPLFRVWQDSSPGDVKLPGRGGSKSDYSPLIAKVKNAWIHESTAPYILMGAKFRYDGIVTFYMHKIKLKETPSLNLVNRGKERNITNSRTQQQLCVCLARPWTHPGHVPKHCRETSVRNHQSTLSNIPEERRPHWHRGDRQK